MRARGLAHVVVTDAVHYEALERRHRQAVVLLNRHVVAHRARRIQLRQRAALHLACTLDTARGKERLQSVALEEAQCALATRRLGPLVVVLDGRPLHG